MSDHIPDVTKMINDTPAFPCVYYSEPIGSIGPQLIIKGGMTLRDYFAAAAMRVILEDPKTRIPQAYVALNAYYMADAMLKAREAK
jgi:hypothetical protein